MYKYILY